MATYNAIAATSNAFITLLKNASTGTEFSSLKYELYQTKNFANAMEEGVSVYLYRVGSGARRNLPVRTSQNGGQIRPVITLDLYYMLTAWGKNALAQQCLLGWCMYQLSLAPSLHALLLNKFIPDTFQSIDSIEVLFDPLSLQDTANVWEPLKSNHQASATYIARMVTIESVVDPVVAAPVQTRQFDMVKEQSE